MSDIAAKIAENVAQVRGRMADAASRSGRDPSCVKLIAVTKYVTAEWMRPLVAAGCLDLGESRPQQIWEKAVALADLPIRWHMIGHFQRNKVRRTLPLLTLTHSIDSLRLLEAVAEEADHPMRVLLEVNVSGDRAKGGFSDDALELVVPRLAEYRNVQVVGLMCMAGLESDADATRREFASLRSLRDRLRRNCPDGVSLDELSMGMSGDYAIAIEEGATMVRIGSALFEGIDR